MPEEENIPELDRQNIEIDAVIIANAKLHALQDAGLAAAGDKGRAVEPFLCYRRGYLIQDFIILMFDPDLLDIRRSVLTLTTDSIAPLEVWILHDDEVVEYFELGNHQWAA